MNHEHQKVTEQDLHALVDGQLSQERMSIVHEHLNQYPEDAKKVASWTLQKKNLKLLFDPVSEEPIPPTLIISNQQENSLRFLSRVAAVVVWIAVGMVSGWWIHDAQSPSELLAKTPEFVNRAAMAHAVYTPEVRHPVEVTADQEQHLVNWLSKRLKGKVKIPHFRESGYNLVGGRLLPGVDNAAAQFMYENSSGTRLTLYVSKTDEKTSETAFHFAKNDSNNLFYWVEPDFAYVLTGKIPRANLLKLANRVYQQLTEPVEG